MTRPKISPELLADQVRVSDPQVSPDGSMVAYVRQPVAKSGEHGTSEVWLVRMAGTDDHRLTSGAGKDGAPRWSPDGRHLAFASDRADPGTAQLYVLAMDGGEAVSLTRRKSGVTQPSWSPDGNLLAFLSKDETSESEEKDVKERRDQIVADENLKFDRLYVVEWSGGEPVLVSPEGPSQVWSYCWSADGRLAMVTTPTPFIADQRNSNTLLIAATQADPSPTLRTAMVFPSEVASPRWSPDGKRIAFLATTGRVKTADQLHVLELASSAYRPVLPGYEGSIADVRWLDSNRLLFTAQENLHGAVRILDLRSGSAVIGLAEQDREKGSFGDSVSVGRRRIAVARSESDHPAQIYAGELGKPLHPLTSANQQLAAAKPARAEPVSWVSADGLEIHGLWMRPRPGSRPFPTVLVIHGGPASAFSDRFSGNWHDWAQLLAANGYAVLMPNPRGSTGRGDGFTDANVGDLGGKELQDDFAGLDLMIERGLADPDRLAIAGWSHGGYITAWTVTQTDRFKAAIAGAAVTNMISDQGTNDIPGFNLDYFFEDYGALYRDPAILWERSPLKHVTRVTTPTLILHGEKDDRVSASQGREFYRALKSLNVPTQFVLYPRETHRVEEREHQIDLQRRILAWLDRWL